MRERNLQIGIDRGNEMFEELGISFGTALIVLLALYFIIKWAVKNGIKEAYRDITGKSLPRILRQNKYVTKRKNS